MDMSLFTSSSTALFSQQQFQQGEETVKYFYVTPQRLILFLLIKKLLVSKDEPVAHRTPILLFILKLLKDTSVFEDYAFAEFLQKLQEVESPLALKLYDDLLETVSNLNTVNDVFQVFDDLEFFDVRPQPLLSLSEIGKYVQRLIYEFRKMKFEDISEFLDTFRQYTKIQPADITTTRFHVFQEYQIEKFLDSQVQHFHDTMGLKPPKELQAQLRRIFEVAPEQEKVDYVNFLNACRQGEFVVALEALHRYFDRCKVKDLSPYAMLNLASLNIQFEYYEEAIHIIRETTMLARGNRDHVCLSFALSWLQRLGDNIDRNSLTKKANLLGIDDQQVLDSILGRGHDYNLFYVQSLGELSQSQNIIEKGGAPSQAFQSIQNSAVENYKNNLHSLSMTNYLVQSKAWDVYGNSNLSILSAQISLLHHSENALPEELLTTYCILAHQLHQQGQSDAALGVMMDARNKYGVSSRLLHGWAQCLRHILFDRTLNSGRLDMAHRIIESSPNDEVPLLTLQLLRRSGLYFDAASCVNNRLLFDRNINPEQLDVFLERARVDIDCGCPSSALIYVLRILHLSFIHHYSQQYCKGMLLFCEILLEFEFPSKSLELISLITPHVLANGPKRLVGDLHLIRAKAQLTFLSKDDENFSKNCC